MEEIGELDGWATIHSIMPYQTPAEGHGNVVTGRFKTRLVKGIKQVWLSNRESFAGTASHPVWVCNREEFVRLDELQVGDELDTLEGTSKVVRIKSISTRQDVYNIEVDRKHVYRIGTTGVLVHNVGDDDCPLVNIGHAPNSGKWNRPNVQDSTLRDVMDNLWRPQDKRPGGMIAELLREKASGGPLIHLEKARGRLTQLIRRVNDLGNPLSKADRAVAERVINDLKDAIRIAEGGWLR